MIFIFIVVVVVLITNQQNILNKCKNNKKTVDYSNHSFGCFISVALITEKSPTFVEKKKNVGTRGVVKNIFNKDCIFSGRKRDLVNAMLQYTSSFHMNMHAYAVVCCFKECPAKTNELKFFCFFFCFSPFYNCCCYYCYC